MINKEICEKIWRCHREIEASEGLLAEVDRIIEINKNRSKEELPKGIKDAFGRECNLELGVPTDHNAKRIFTVSWELAVPVIKTHIANKVAELNELNIIAKAQLETV